MKNLRLDDASLGVFPLEAVVGKLMLINRIAHASEMCFYTVR